MTYDVALWKPKAKATDSVGLIAMTLSEGYPCKAVSRFPVARFVSRLQEIFGCPVDDLHFEVDVTSQGALLGLPHSDSSAPLESLTSLARELGLHFHDFQEHSPSEVDIAEFQRREREKVRSQDEETFHFAMESAWKGSLKDMHFVASCYRYGTGVTRDLGNAVEWYEKAACGGMSKALMSLADMYREDFGDESSLKKGLDCLERAAAVGSPAALAMLAEWTRDGVGRAPDACAAVAFWRQLLDADTWFAAFELAKAYEHGNGADQSTSTAIDYYRKAREAGHPEALRNLRRLGAET